MSRAPASIALQNLQPLEAASSVSSAGLAPPVSDGLLSIPGGTATRIPSSSATSSAGNSNNQLNHAPKPRKSRFALPQCCLKWWLELLGAISSILLLVAIVTFLIVVDGSKLDDWHLLWEIKPPTIISILVTLCRINLTFFVAEGIGQLKWVFFEQRSHQLADFDQFDEATRGP